jgi:hypothetical protein
MICVFHGELGQIGLLPLLLTLSGIPIGITLQILLMATEPLRKRHLTN